VVGKRTQENADRLVEKINRVTDDHIPLFSSDELPHYKKSLLKTYGVDEQPIREPGKRGRPRKSRRLPHPDLDYVQVMKHRKKRRVVSIETAIVFGDEERIAKRLLASPVSRSINISFVERNNLTMRQSSHRLARKTNGFSKELAKLEAHLDLTSGYYHFVKEHLGLREKVVSTNRRWRPRTPAMAAGITDHIWSTRELLIYRVPPQISTMWGH